MTSVIEDDRTVMEMELCSTMTQEQYRRYLAEIEKLVGDDPLLDSTEGARLELLAKLVEDHEKALYRFD